MTDETARNDASHEIGRVFGQLTLVRPTGELIRGVKVYECRCACGNLDKATISLLMMGRKTSCGCQNRTKSDASKPELHEVERLRALVADDGRDLGEIALAAGLTESLVADGLLARRRLTLATTCSLLRALHKHWSDLDEPTEPTHPTNRLGAGQESDRLSLDLGAGRNPLPRVNVIRPNGAGPRHLAALLTRNRFEPPRLSPEGTTLAIPFADGESPAFGGEQF